MKKVYWYIAATEVFILFLVSVAIAENPEAIEKKLTSENLDQIEQNLVIALETEMPSLQTSAAIVLKQVKWYAPEYGFSNAVIPLMCILKNEHQNTTARIAAALALHDLKSSVGDYAIKRTAQFTDVERVKQICASLAYERIKEKRTTER